MRVHHLNCATLCPPRFLVGNLICHCLVIETARGLVLVDTALGSHDLAAPRERLSRAFVAVVRPRLDRAEAARAQIERLGFSARDVRHIIVTHLDRDHAGGLSDFPEAEVHVAADELATALHPPSRRERRRYRTAQWAHGPRWKPHAAGGEPWHGFGGVRAVDGLPSEILLVPLGGHTRGHHGIAVRLKDGWLLHAGDAYYFHGELERQGRCPWALRAFQRLVAADDQARVANQALLRALALDPSASVRIVSAHDPIDLERCRATPEGVARFQ
jgi:glyoxylase-like metal-dependent hydrolase (beta-lactamase superfamily II)